MLLTSKTVAGLQLAEGEKDRIIFDDACPGFGIRLREGGSRKWVIQYKLGGRTNRLALGHVSAMKLEKARELAGEQLARVKLGLNPAQEKRDRLDAERHTFGHLVHDYLARYKQRPRTVEAVSYYLNKSAKQLHHRPVDAITHKDVAALLRQVEQKVPSDKGNGAATVNRLRAVLSQVFAWGVGEGLCAANPVSATNPRDEKPRERVLSHEELRAVWLASDQCGDFGRIVKLLVLTAQRRGEVAGIRAEEIKENIWLIPAARVKNHKAHCVPLSRTVIDILASVNMYRGRFPKQNWSVYKDKLDKLCGVKDWTLHDLRRTAATMMAQDLKVPPHIVEAILNHSPGKLQATYNRADYREEKRQALEAWDAHVRGFVS
jgi:integrase